MRCFLPDETYPRQVCCAYLGCVLSHSKGPCPDRPEILYRSRPFSRFIGVPVRAFRPPRLLRRSGLRGRGLTGRLAPAREQTVDLSSRFEAEVESVHPFPFQGRAADRLFSWKGCGACETSHNGERYPGRAVPDPGVIRPPRLRQSCFSQDETPGGQRIDAARGAEKLPRHSATVAFRRPAALVPSYLRARMSGGGKGVGRRCNKQTCHPG